MLLLVCCERHVLQVMEGHHCVCAIPGTLMTYNGSFLKADAQPEHTLQTEMILYNLL